ncbi:MAG TPA: sensor histidine kinase [Bacillota bacterium]|nr:sensor histidine kinase [Bacillota bacterium]
MKNITLKIIISLVCCSLIIALILSGVAITKSNAVMRTEVRKELVYASQKYASQFSAEFQTQENVVDLICTMVSGWFDVEDYTNDRERFLALEKRLDRIIKNTMEDIPETRSLYFTFNPETSGGNDEIWYLRSEKGKVYYTEADNTVENWLVDGANADAYYFDAIRKGKSWRSVEYDQYLKTYSVTYSRACRDKSGALVGVMGTDILIDHIFDTVKHIQMREGGSAFLTDGDFNYLAGSTSKEDFAVMKKDGILNLPADFQNSSDYTAVKGEHYLTTYAKTSNGWIVALVQREETLLRPIQDMKRILYTMALITLIAVLAYSYYFSKKSLAPIVQEFEEKDIIMLHQSRQAKLGEMVGNIAHQWKQPLNVMNIILSNLWDDFGQGNLTEEQLKSHIEDMRSHIRNMSGTVDDFADFLKPSRKKEKFSVNEAMDTTLGLMTESIKINRISVVRESGEKAEILGYRNEFCQGIFNILNNARDAIIDSDPEKREIRIRIYSVRDGKQRSAAVIDITNQGDQIAPEIINRLFEPYFTTKDEKGGTGIGLYLTKEIIESHMNGTVEMFNVPGGVCCRVTIPKEVHND